MTAATPMPQHPADPDPSGDDIMVLTTARPAEQTGDDAHVANTIRRVCSRIAPLWPLERFVAVNPYLGLTDLGFDHAAQRLARVAGIRTAMPAAFYLGAVAEGRITTDDLAAALARDDAATTRDPDRFLALVQATIHEDDASEPLVATVSDIAESLSGKGWARFTTDRVSAWAAAYFDEGQSTWHSTDRSLPVFPAWKADATLDRTPEVMGLRGFRAAVRELPDDALATCELAFSTLGLTGEAADLYLHALLLRVAGWAGHCARIVWEHAQRGQDDETLVQFLAVLLAWELAILQSPAVPGIDAAWRAATHELSKATDEPQPCSSLVQRVILQDAFDHAAQRTLIEQFRTARETDASGVRTRPDVQAVFCIDVRSEVLRRHLEATSTGIDTMGFAGFFGFPVEYVHLGHEHGEAQCPVLLTPGAHVREVLTDPAATAEAVAARQLGHFVRRAWKSFKMGAISCFSFVGPVGLMYLPKLVTDSVGATRPVQHPDTEALPAWAVGHTAPSVESIPVDDRVHLAEGALRGMSLTDRFARLVLIVGHGSTTVNNPYATGLDCGACGGHTGAVNARVAAAILNDSQVRAALATSGIRVPDDTWFVAALHDTTTDCVTVYDREAIPTDHHSLLVELTDHLAVAGRTARAERAARLGIAADTKTDSAVLRRSTDWAQVRPEWGLAGCRAFVVAPRERTKELDLGGRAFLHSYDWQRDHDFSVLTLIMTAPMVVASWISLQYYASTVDNRSFGSGNKTLHNVVGRIGVLEGNAGDLRSGLPWQSLHDGETLRHEPLRLAVMIEAPIDAINEVLAAHESVRSLCDNGWVFLLAMDGTGQVSHRYAGNLGWEECIT